MNSNRIKRTRMMAAVAVILCLANSFRYLSAPGIRAVEMLSFMALGLAIGALIGSFAIPWAAGWTKLR